MVTRVYVEKKPGFDVEARRLAAELRDVAGISGLTNLRLINRYDIEGIDEELLERCLPTVFAEPQVDNAYTELPRVPGAAVFAVEALPGQFDQRATSASECIQLMSQGERPTVRSAKVYLLEGELSEEDVASVERYVVNPVESRVASLDLPETLAMEVEEPAPVEVLDGFRALDRAGLAAFIDERGLAMDLDDIAFCQEYFKGEGRDPTITEVRVLDTYWSDHCRHTTFGTNLTSITIDDEEVQTAFDRYLEARDELGREDTPLCLMDMATIGAKYLTLTGALSGLDESDEVNACSVRTRVNVDGHDEDWLLLFKNETHNHPTEIEPFGGAATCLGGAIRDPLSGRSYVYQAMRVTGAGDPTAPVSETLPGKLPQRKLTTTAAEGYSSYGNQVGLATGQVSELYHTGYTAKRMEIGAVVGATPADHVRRETPKPGNKIVLLGGRTGRDGIGGATGSSKTQDAHSVETSGAEVQKGNPPVERKLQRLFRRKDACRLIKRCNDFGAGGVAVAVGELADGLDIDLDRVTKKYEGLDGTELAISESQERMAVVVSDDDVDELMDIAAEENLEATVVAEVAAEPRVRMTWRGETVVDLSRAFLNSNGAPKYQDVHVGARGVWEPSWEGETFGQRMHALVSDLNVASNKGLAERFDSTIGAGTVLMPFGGKTQLTPAQAMVAKFPVTGETITVSGMAWGFNPYLMEQDQFAGAYLSVVESVSKLVATGFEHERVYLTFQEYFERLRNDPDRWGKPVAALLGALEAQLDLGLAAIGGKDSMSGSFEDMDVPPTLVSFAVATGNLSHVVSPEFKGITDRVIRVAPATYGPDHRPDPTQLLETFFVVESLIMQGDALAVSTPGYGGCAEAIFKMCVGNTIGIELVDELDLDQLFEPMYGSFFIELSDREELPQMPKGVELTIVGTTVSGFALDTKDETVDLYELRDVWEGRLEGVFPYRSAGKDEAAADTAPTDEAAAAAAVMEPPAQASTIPQFSYRLGVPHVYSGRKIARPRVIIPVFPGTNCEYDSARAFERAGALADVFVINNLSPGSVAASSRELARRIRQSQIIMIPGGFSGGDEPDGSAKFINAFFRSPEVTEAVRDLLQNRDGLILGICNGFQALVKLGLVPYGDIVDPLPGSPTLACNTIGRHQSRLVRTRIASNLSPWFSCCNPDTLYTVPVSHGEGRFVANEDELCQLAATGQIATQYVDETGIPRADLSVNPNGSMLAIEGITSPDGRVLGKMGHAERRGRGLYQNVPGETYMPLFEGGVEYFA